MAPGDVRLRVHVNLGDLQNEYVVDSVTGNVPVEITMVSVNDWPRTF